MSKKQTVNILYYTPPTATYPQGSAVQATATIDMTYYTSNSRWEPAEDYINQAQTACGTNGEGLFTISDPGSRL